MVGTKNVVQKRPIGADDNDDEKETKEPNLIAEHVERGDHGFEHGGVGASSDLVGFLCRSKIGGEPLAAEECSRVIVRQACLLCVLQ